MSNSGWTMTAEHKVKDYKWTGTESGDSCAVLAAKILDTLQAIPDFVEIAHEE